MCPVTGNYSYCVVISFVSDTVRFKLDKINSNNIIRHTRVLCGLPLRI